MLEKWTQKISNEVVLRRLDEESVNEESKLTGDLQLGRRSIQLVDDLKQG